MPDEQRIPRDEFSEAMRTLSDNPGGVRRQSIVELKDFYGNVVTWIITTFRVDGADTVLMQRQTSEGAARLVLPPDVTAAIARHREQAIKVNRRRGARTAAATREARGIRPHFGRRRKE